MKLILCLDQKFIMVVKSKKTIKQGSTGQGHIHLGQGHMAAFFYYVNFIGLLVK